MLAGARSFILSSMLSGMALRGWACVLFAGWMCTCLRAARVRACMHPSRLHLCAHIQTQACMHKFAPARMHTHARATHANKTHENRYDVTRAQWDVVCNMTVARRGLGLCVLPGDAAGGVRDLLFAAGGQDDTTSRTVEVFDASTESWRLVAAMGERRINFGFVALGGHLYAIGGWDGENILQSCEKYYPERDEWVEIAELPQPRCLAQVVAVLLMDRCSRLACSHHGSG